ncbi:PGLP2, partial [Symbiodinium necroappetens]
MLIESLHHSTSTDGDATLHPHQVRLLGIVRDALLDGKSKLEAAKVTVEESLQEAEMHLAAQDSKTTAALASEVSACHSAAAAEAAAKDTETEVAETEQELERKRGLAKDVIQETAALQKRRLKASDAEASLKCLAEGTWAREEEWWECFAALQQHLLDTGAENSLLTAATLALKKKPDERSSFHVVAVEGVGNFFRQQLAAADQELVQQSRLEMEAEATILGIEALLTATRQRACQRREAADAGAASKESMQSAARQAEKCLQASKEAVAQKQQEQVDLEGRLTTVNEALELVGAWMAGNALPTAVEVPLPLQSPAPEEAE